MRNVIHPNEINEVMNAKRSVKNPVIGMLATMFVGSDRYAVVVTEVMNDKHIRVKTIYDDSVLENHTAHMKTGYTDNDYDYLPLEYLANSLYVTVENNKWCGTGKEYTLRKNGRWLPVGSGLWDTCSIHLGTAENYRDPSF